MRQAKAGYTIIEVMIVLAISGTLLIAAITMFSAKKGGAEFTQAMYDINSKIQSYASDVSAGVFVDSDRYSCSMDASSGRANVVLIGSGTQNVGTKKDCIFLGKALQVAKDTTTMSTYTVLGNRTKIVGIQKLPVLVFDDSKPTPILINDLVEVYRGSFSAVELLWSRVDSVADPAVPDAPETDLVGIYNSLQGSDVTSSQTRSQSLIMKSYELPSSSTTDVKACIEQTACVRKDIKSWYMCFRSRTAKNTAILAVNSTPAGITSSIIFNNDLNPTAKCLTA